MTGRHRAGGRHSGPPARRRHGARSLAAVSSGIAVLLALWTASLAPEPATPSTPHGPGSAWRPPQIPELRIPGLAPALAAASEPTTGESSATHETTAHPVSHTGSSHGVIVRAADGSDDPPPTTPTRLTATPRPTPTSSSHPTTTEVSSGRRAQPGSCDPGRRGGAG